MKANNRFRMWLLDKLGGIPKEQVIIPTITKEEVNIVRLGASYSVLHEDIVRLGKHACTRYAREELMRLLMKQIEEHIDFSVCEFDSMAMRSYKAEIIVGRK